MAEIKELLEMALKASSLAEEQILKYYGSSYEVSWKEDQTPVTIADQKAEEVMRSFVEKERKDIGFIWGEFGIQNPAASDQWIMDPIDGTKAFSHGGPLFGTHLALYKNGKPCVGLIQLPALKTCLWASQGAGAYVDGKRVHCSSVSILEESLVLSGTINTMEDNGFGESFKTLRRASKLYRGWGDCYGYYLVASGRAEIMVDSVVSLWDIAPMPVIFSEAGGVFSTIAGETSLFNNQGEPIHSIYEGYTGLGCAPSVYSKVQEILSE